MTKKFFFVCAGLLCLAVAYHLGARSAHGQVSTTIDGAHIWSPYGPVGSAWITGVVGRVFYSNGAAIAAPVPGTARAIATTGIGSSEWPYAVLLENGDFYYGTGTSWSFYGNVLGGAPTAGRPTTWGGLKAHYR